jgi:muramoyltetrapeptide carboxypeptidase
VSPITKPTALRAGARIAVLSPASTPKPELVHAGMDRLRAMGYEPILSPHALDRGPLYYAGSLEDRLADLHAAFADPAIDGILCTRGGWGSAELLPHLNATLIAANPKVFIGYSDQTSLQVWLRNEANLVSFYAPMVASDFARTDGIDLPSWKHALEATNLWTLGPPDGLRTLRAGVAEGELHGGCLSIFAEALGTPYAPHPRNGILFVEDIGVKPYQWDRLLLHLRYAGVLDHVQGIVLGDMDQCVPANERDLLEQAILHSLRDFKGPIAIGLRSGHVDAPNITLPLGVRVRLDCSVEANPRMDFLEAAVTL